MVIGAGLSNASSAMTVASVTFVGALAKMGMEAVESEALVRTTFGNMTDDINQWSNNASDKLGFNAYEMRRNAALFQNLFKGAEIDPIRAQKWSKSLTDAKNDLVAFYNLDDKVAFGKLTSLLAGETEPGRDIGIFLNEDVLKQHAIKKGIVETNRELNEQEKIAARVSYLLENFQRRGVTGAAEREKDNPASVLRRQQNELKTAMTDIGMSLMPVTSDLLKMTQQLVPPIKDAVKWFTSLDETTRRWVLGIGLSTGPLAIIGTKLMNVAVMWKTLRGGGGASGGGAASGGPLDDILGSAKAKATAKLTAAIKAKLGLGDDDDDAGGGGPQSMSVRTMNVTARRVYLTGPITSPRGAVPGAAGAGAAGAGAAGAGASWAARLGLAGTTAFGMGVVGTGAVIGTGAVAAYKTPTYLRDAGRKSDEEMAQSSDPLQRFHGWAAPLAERSVRRIGRGLSVADKVLQGYDLESAQRQTTWDEDAGFRAGEKAKKLSQNSQATKDCQIQKKLRDEMPQRQAASEAWMEKNVGGWTSMRAQQRDKATELSSVNTTDKTNRRRLASKWASENFGERGYMKSWDSRNGRSMLLDKREEMQRKPSAIVSAAARTFGLIPEKSDEAPLTARGRAVAEHFGFVPEEDAAAGGDNEVQARGQGKRMPGGNIRVTFAPVEIQAGEPERDARDARFIAATPSPVI
jgi:hypothetical protein